MNCALLRSCAHAAHHGHERTGGTTPGEREGGGERVGGEQEVRGWGDGRVRVRE